MRSIDWLRWVFRAVTTNPTQSLLTSLGIAIGIAAVTTLTSIGEGVQHYILTSFSQFGTHLIAVKPGKVNTAGVGQFMTTVKPLLIEDSEFLERIPGIKYVVPVVMGIAPAEYDKFSRSTNVFGVDPNAPQTWQLDVKMGRFLPEDDPLAPRALAVLGHRVYKEFFRNNNPIGEIIRVGGTRFRIIGVMEEKGQFLGFDLDDGIYIPTQKAQLIFNQEGVLEIDVVFDPELTTSKETRNRLKKLMTQLHGREDFTLLTQEDMIASLDKILNIMKGVIGSLGGIALIVGGVGVFTIMTTSMKERTQEIGLLTALGTTKKLILTLFLGEAICLSTLGGALGLGVVVSAISVMKFFVPGLPLILNPVFLLFALSVSSVIGLFAGIYPAHLASNLNPIDALRAE